MTMTVSETLNKAADLIEERGWNGRNSGGDPWGTRSENAPICLEGGIVAAAGLTRDHIGSMLLRGCAAARAVHQYLQISGELWAWNDKSGRTAEEVIEVLRSAAVIEASRENADAKVAVSA